MHPDTHITIQVQSSARGFGETTETTWGAFVAQNDPDTIEDVLVQFGENNRAQIGGGASPVVWIFRTPKRPRYLANADGTQSAMARALGYDENGE